MATNKAAYLTTAKAYPLQVKAAPYTSPREHEIVVKNKAVAINPADWIKQDTGSLVFPYVKYPFILGCDVAGQVVEVGPGVTRLKVGDRVLGYAVGLDEKRNTSTESAFQLYTVLLDYMVSPIPSTMSYEDAAVIPLGVSAAACGMFQEDQLDLHYPSLNPKPTGKTLLIWGGSSSVGCNAIQLAVSAGYEVITTASPRNFDLVKRLGASLAFDYNSKTVVQDIIHAFKGRKIAGALSTGYGSAAMCLDVLSKCEGDKVLSMASFPQPPSPPKNFVLLQSVFYYMTGTFSVWLKAKTRGIRADYISGSSLVHNGVGKAVYVDFLPQALADGRYVPAPDTYVFGQGLENIQGAMDVQKKGVSAKKVVVSL